MHSKSLCPETVLKLDARYEEEEEEEEEEVNRTALLTAPLSVPVVPGISEGFTLRTCLMQVTLPSATSQPKTTCARIVPVQRLSKTRLRGRG